MRVTSRSVSWLALAGALALHGCGEDPAAEGGGLDGDPSGDAADGVGDGRDALDTRPEPGDPKADRACDPAAAGAHFEWLDDPCGRKVYPSDRDRDFTCPNVATTAEVTLADGRVVRYLPADAPIAVDGDALRGVVRDDFDVAVILVRRVDGVPHYRYLSNGTHNRVFQPWSSTKFLAVANAAARLREASRYAVGLGGSAGGLPLGDLVTEIATYAPGHYTSNALARWFHDVGGRARANALIHDGWLHRPATESFGGNYGAPSPPLAYRFTDGDATLTVQPDRTSGPRNALSALTLAEALKRLVMHREDAATRLPGLQWADLRVLFYGAARSTWFPGRWGGLSADTALFVQSGVDLGALDAATGGRWRIFSKLGFGDGQFVHDAYACLPRLDADGVALPDEGVELVIAGRLGAGGASWRARDRLMAAQFAAIVERVADGRLR